MICKNPYSKKGVGAAIPCGQCLPCRINHRRVWTHRIMLEARLWPHNSFVTLTYRDDALPPSGVSVQEHQAFMKQLRAQWHDATGQLLRFYMCGEYGEKTFRPHYHYALFNFPTCAGPGPKFVNRRYYPCHCQNCSFLARVWSKGHVYLGTLTTESAQYVAGYVTKKMTKEDDPRLSVVDPETGEIHAYNPEFSRMSRRPGIGAGFVPALLDHWRASGSVEPPTGFRHGNRFLPLGRYLKGKVDEILEVEPLSPAALEARQMFSMLKDIKNDPEVFAQSLAYASSAAVALQLVNSQRSLKLEQRHKRKANPNEI